MRTSTTRMNLSTESLIPQATMSLSTGMIVYTRMAKIITITKNAVPQRTCRRGNWRAFSGVSSSPCSRQ